MKMTKLHLDKLNEEIQQLREDEIKYKQLVEDARAEGDLSENHAYHDSKNELAKIQKNIKQLETRRDNADIVSIDNSDLLVEGSYIEISTLKEGCEPDVNRDENWEESKLLILFSEGNILFDNILSTDSEIGKLITGKSCTLESYEIINCKGYTHRYKKLAESEKINERYRKEYKGKDRFFKELFKEI